MHFLTDGCWNAYTKAFPNSVGHNRPFINYATFIFVILNYLPPNCAFLYGVREGYMGFQWVVHLKSNPAPTQSVMYVMDGPYMLACAVYPWP